MKYLYKYPQAAFPYAQLVEENQRRTTLDRDFVLVDTGIFDEGRYFDIVMENGKLEAEDMLIRLSISNRGNEAAPIQVLPTHRLRRLWRPAFVSEKVLATLDQCLQVIGERPVELLW
jgi:hypothetical protein